MIFSKKKTEKIDTWFYKHTYSYIFQINAISLVNTLIKNFSRQLIWSRILIFWRVILLYVQNIFPGIKPKSNRKVITTYYRGAELGRVRDDTFFCDLRSLTIILPNCDLRSLTIIFWKSHDRWSRSWSAILFPITLNI